MQKNVTSINFHFLFLFFLSCLLPLGFNIYIDKNNITRKLYKDLPLDIKSPSLAKKKNKKKTWNFFGKMNNIKL